MKEQAVKKLRDEMAANEKQPYIQVIGNFLIQHLEAHPETAEGILANGKTIKGSTDAMKAEAKKKQVGGVGVLTDAEGFEIVLKYFGVKPKKPVNQGSFFDAQEHIQTGLFSASMEEFI